MDTRPQSATGASDQTPLQQLSDFSLVAGGPLYRLWRRTRLSGDALELPQRRVLALVVLIWVPLLVLSMIDGRAWGDGVALPFLQDIETHLRLLIAAPLLILAEVVVHRSLLPIVRQFVDNGLIRDEARAQFDAAIASALRLRNSVVVELLLVVFVYAVGMPLVWRDQLALDVNSWYATVDGRRVACVQCRPVAGVREHARAPVPDAALVLQVLRLGALPVAGVAHAVEPGADASRRHRRTALPRAQRPRVPVRAAGARHDALRHDRQPDLPRRRHAARVQGRDRRRGRPCWCSWSSGR